MSRRRAKSKRCSRQAKSHFGTLHIVVSNAGLQRDAPFDKMTLEQWNTVLGINLTGQFLTTRAAVREFRRVVSSRKSPSPPEKSSA